jgi:hypothetical protein
MRRRIEWAIGAVFVVVVVLIVPIATFDGVTGPPQVDSTQEIASPDALFDLGTPYVLRETRVLPISSSPQGIAALDDPSGILTDDTLEAFLIASEGGMWVVDRPAETVPSGRIRLFGSEEYPTSDFLVPSGAALFAPASDGGLWIGFAVGDDGGEIVRRYSSAGELLGEYPLPENVFARSLSVAPTGELWVQVEESEVDMDTFASTYRSHLLPIAVGEDLTPAPDPRAGALDGNFIGFGRRRRARLCAYGSGTGWYECEIRHSPWLSAVRGGFTGTRVLRASVGSQITGFLSWKHWRGSVRCD